MKAFSKNDNLVTALSKVPFSRSRLHGLCGCGILAATTAEVAQFAWSRRPNVELAYFISLMGTLLCIGLLERQYRLRIEDSHRKSGLVFLWIRAIGLTLAFSSLSISWYANPSVPFVVNAVALTIAGTGILLTFGAFMYDILQCRVARGTLTANSTAFCVLFLVPGIHLYLGHEAFVQLVEDYPQITKSFYIVMVVSTLIECWDSFALGLSAAGRLSGDTYHKIALVNWAILYVGLVAMFLWRLWNAKLALASFLYFLGTYIVSSPIERRLIEVHRRCPLKYKSNKTSSFESTMIRILSGFAVGGVCLCWTLTKW